MREKYLQYIREIGLRYAVHYAKYEGITLAVCQLWSIQHDDETLTQIRRYYNEQITIR